eukprot:2518021-Prymnesium_polylepis.1
MGDASPPPTTSGGGGGGGSSSGGGGGGGGGGSGGSGGGGTTTGGDGSTCTNGGQVSDYCSETLAYQVARCYMSTTSLKPPVWDDSRISAYDNMRTLAAEFRMGWTVHGSYPHGAISIILQARTVGWLGFGLMSDTEDVGSASGNGMINTDIFLGAVVDGNATVFDAWSPTVAAPLRDSEFDGHSDDLYDIGGVEDAATGMTTIWFSRRLASNDTWDYHIRPGVKVPVIYAYSRKNVDSFSHYHGPSRGFHHVTFIPLPEEDDPTKWILAGTLAPLTLALVVAVMERKRRLQLAEAELRRLNMLRKEVQATVDSTGSLAFGMVLVSAREFLASGRFMPFEALRDTPHSPLKVLDTLKEARDFARDQTIIFFSHQWLAYDEPDPERVHYQCMSTVVKNIVAQQGTPGLEATWVWVDYSCMPQRNSTTLRLAVSDLSEVASLATYFVVTAPPVVHADTGEACDTSTYQARGWCRLEQFSYVCTGKTPTMLISTGGEAGAFHSYVSQPAEWKQQALGVLRGQFTCCQRTKDHTVGDMPCDKEKLKPALLRMYMKAICNLPPCPLRQQLIDRDREIFPQEDFDDDILK